MVATGTPQTQQPLGEGKEKEGLRQHQRGGTGAPARSDAAERDPQHGPCAGPSRSRRRHGFYPPRTPSLGVPPQQGSPDAGQRSSGRSSLSCPAQLITHLEPALWVNCLIHLCTCAYSKEATVNHKAIETRVGPGESRGPWGAGENRAHRFSAAFCPLPTQPTQRRGIVLFRPRSLDRAARRRTRKQQQDPELPPAGHQGGREGESSAGEHSGSPRLGSPCSAHFVSLKASASL